LNGIVLYAVSTVFVVYISLSGVDAGTWNTLFWIIMLFTAVNGVAKSFMVEGHARWLYYYTITSARSVILSKMIYNLGLMIVMGVITLSVYALMVGNPIQHMIVFLSIMVIGAASLGLVLSMIAAIAAKAGHNTALMAILSFPVVLPILLLTIRLSAATLESGAPEVWKDLAILLAVDGLVVVLSLVLFPYLWRD
jgi:heme exporter protein B